MIHIVYVERYMRNALRCDNKYIFEGQTIFMISVCKQAYHF